MALGAFITWSTITMLHFNEKTSLMQFSDHHIPAVKGRHSTVTRPAVTTAQHSGAQLSNGTLNTTIKRASDLIGTEHSQLKAKKEQVVQSMREIWRNYKEHAWGYDELKPRSQQGDNNWGGLGMSMVDALDTLWLMGLKD